MFISLYEGGREWRVERKRRKAREERKFGLIRLRLRWTGSLLLEFRIAETVQHFGGVWPVVKETTLRTRLSARHLGGRKQRNGIIDMSGYRGLVLSVVVKGLCYTREVYFGMTL